MRRLILPPIHLLVVFASLILVLATAGCVADVQLQSPIASPGPASSGATWTSPLASAPSVFVSPFPVSAGTAIPFQTLSQGFRLGSTLPRPVLLMAVNTASRDAMASYIDPSHQTPLKAVDFERETVLAAFWGTKPYGGFSITISRVLITNTDLTVNVILRENDPTVPKIDASTSPYHLVTVNRLALPKEATLRYRLVSDDTLLATGELP